MSKSNIIIYQDTATVYVEMIWIPTEHGYTAAGGYRETPERSRRGVTVRYTAKYNDELGVLVCDGSCVGDYIDPGVELGVLRRTYDIKRDNLYAMNRGAIATRKAIEVYDSWLISLEFWAEQQSEPAYEYDRTHPKQEATDDSTD